MAISLKHALLSFNSILASDPSARSQYGGWNAGIKKEFADMTDAIAQGKDLSPHQKIRAIEFLDDLGIVVEPVSLGTSLFPTENRYAPAQVNAASAAPIAPSADLSVEDTLKNWNPPKGGFSEGRGGRGTIRSVVSASDRKLLQLRDKILAGGGLSASERDEAKQLLADKGLITEGLRQVNEATRGEELPVSEGAPSVGGGLFDAGTQLSGQRALEDAIERGASPQETKDLVQARDAQINEAVKLAEIDARRLAARSSTPAPTGIQDTSLFPDAQSQGEEVFPKYDIPGVPIQPGQPGASFLPPNLAANVPTDYPYYSGIPAIQPSPISAPPGRPDAVSNSIFAPSALPSPDGIAGPLSAPIPSDPGYDFGGILGSLFKGLTPEQEETLFADISRQEQADAERARGRYLQEQGVETGLIEAQGVSEQKALEDARTRYLKEQGIKGRLIQGQGTNEELVLEAARKRYLQEQGAEEGLFQKQGLAEQGSLEAARSRYLQEQGTERGLIQAQGTAEEKALETARSRYLQEQGAEEGLFGAQSAAQQKALEDYRQRFMQEEEAYAGGLAEKYRGIFQPGFERNIRRGADILGGQGLGSGGFQGSGAAQELVRKGAQELEEGASGRALDYLLGARQKYGQLGLEAARLPGLFGSQLLERQLGAQEQYRNLGLEAAQKQSLFGRQALGRELGAQEQYRGLGLEAAQRPLEYSRQALGRNLGAQEQYRNLGLEAAQTSARFGRQKLASDIADQDRYSELGLEAARTPSLFGRQALERKLGAQEQYRGFGMEAAQIPSIFRRSALERKLGRQDVGQEQAFELGLAQMGASSEEAIARRQARAAKRRGLGSLFGGAIGGALGSTIPGGTLPGVALGSQFGSTFGGF